MAEKTLLLKARGISRHFPGVQALREVDFDVYQGEVIGLVGENGAGKSTLMKILSGVYTFDAGSIELDAHPYRPHSPAEAQASGISTIYQELALIPYLSVAENIFLNREPLRPYTPGLIDYPKMNHDAQTLLAELGIVIDVTRQLKDLAIAVQQMVEIAKAISRSARLIIMDEPTSSLASSDIEVLFRLIQRLKERGIAVIFIGHRMEEVLSIADRVVILRDGELTGNLPIEESSEEQIIRLMVGRKVELYPKTPSEITEPVLEVRQLGNGKAINDIHFAVKRGEIVGMAGLIGAGRTEVARMIFGADPHKTGQIFINGVAQQIASPKTGKCRGWCWGWMSRKTSRWRS
jgi:ABC-type sugar transport system ATPase subunit